MWSLPGKEIQAQGLSFWHALMWTTRDQKNEACYVGHCGLLIAQGWLSLLCWIHPAPVAAPHLEGAKLPLAAAAKPLVCFGSCLPSHQFCPYTSWWTLSQEALQEAHCWGRTDLFPWHGISSPPWEVSCLWAAWAQLQLTASYQLGWPMWLLMLCGLHVWTLWGDVSTSDVIYVSGFIWQGSMLC